jgi:A/G-specific adenine glycosylase
MYDSFLGISGALYLDLFEQSVKYYFSILLDHFPLNSFPHKKLLSWFRKNQRKLPWRTERTPYTTWISEVMLQQTQVKQVESYFKLFLDRFPDIQTLAKAPLERVLKVWEGLGYYSRARHLHQTAQILVSRCNGGMPSDFEEVLKLPGIGRSTAGAILSLAFGKPFPVLDGNIRRVLIRFFYFNRRLRTGDSQSQLWKRAAQILPAKNAGRFNEALMELGALVCTPNNPECGRCPLQETCRAFRVGRQNDLPLKGPSKKIPHFDVTAAVIRKGDKILITQRPAKGLLGGLWEFPGGKKEPGESLEDCLKREIREELSIEVKVGEGFIQVPHAYSHFRITLHCYFCRWVKGRLAPLGVKDYRWIHPEELDHFAFPRADQKVIAYLTKHI